MPRKVNCPDGTVVRGNTDVELVAGVEAWLARTNPRLTGTLTVREILAGAVEDESPIPASRSTTGGHAGSPDDRGSR